MLHVEKIFTDITGIRKNLQNWWEGETYCQRSKREVKEGAILNNLAVEKALAQY